MYSNKRQSSSGMGMWLLVGAALGAAACLGLTGMPTQRKVRRRLMNAADAVNDAIDSMYRAMK